MRIQRTVGENRRIGYPNAEKRLEILEALILELAIKAGVDKTELDSLISKMDRMDIDFPDRLVVRE